jgi:predicted nucleic acid-binding protein
VTVVVDSSALITLARIGRLELLHRIADVIHVPTAVFEEVVQKGAGRPGSGEVAQSLWIRRRNVRDVASVDRLRARVGRGEAEAIVLAKELGADILVIDDAAARRLAESEGQRVIGLPGLLVFAKYQGVILEIRPILDEILAAGFFLDDSRYQSLLRQAGEER